MIYSFPTRLFHSYDREKRDSLPSFSASSVRIQVERIGSAVKKSDPRCRDLVFSLHSIRCVFVCVVMGMEVDQHRGGTWLRSRFEWRCALADRLNDR